MRKGKRPNVLFIISDDHRHDAIHTRGNQMVQTPVLDQLAAKGVSFTQTHIMGGQTGAVCMPSRASVHAGANVFRAGGDQDINPELALMPETFKENGYETYAIGKWHNDFQSFNRSFTDGSALFFGGMSDHYHVPIYDYQENGIYPKEKMKMGNKHSSELFADAAIDFLRHYDSEKPFFLYVANTAPHDPRTAPKAYHDMYNEDEMELPPNFVPEPPFDNGEMDVRDEHLATMPRNESEVRQHIADYYAMISHLDAQTGRILETLEKSNFSDNTIIVYTADHGLAVGQHGLLGKQNMYDHSIRIPLIMNGPGLKAGHTIDTLVSQIDIFPTLCSLVNIDVPKTVEGMSHLPSIRGEEQTDQQYVYAIYRDIQRMVKNDRYKLIRYYHQTDRNEGTDYLQLFDLKEDPWEMNNLINDPRYKHVTLQLADALKSWQQTVGDPLVHIEIMPNN